MAKNSTPPEPEKPVPEAASFWATGEPAAPAYKKRFAEQISRLQERQLELVKETSAELENLKRELEENKEIEERMMAIRQPLLAEITHLQQSIHRLEDHNAALEKQLKETQTNYQKQYEQLQGILNSMLGTLQTTALPELAAPAVAAPAAQQSAKFTAHEEKIKTESEKKHAAKPLLPRKPLLRRFAMRTLVLLLIVGGGYGGFAAFKHMVKNNLANATAEAANTGTVAGVSTDQSITSSSTDDEYPEAFVNVPFNQTVWKNISDPVFGISFDYPKNTSDEARPVGGNNLWIVRNYGYLMEVTEDASVSTLADWQTANQSHLSTEYAIANGTFKNLPALVLTPLASTNTSGTEYVIKQQNFILIFWIKSLDPQSDDGLRVTHMVNSLQITKPTIQE